MQQEISAKKKFLIDRSFDGEETRVAVIKDGVLEDFDHELSSKRLKKGNVYLAQVTRVEAALQAAFLEFGDKKQGFLAFSEIHPQYYQKKNRSSPESVDQEVNVEPVPPSLEGNLNEEEADIELKVVRTKNFLLRIQDVIKKGQVLLVQVVKDMRGNKGAALTTYISLAGRFIVFMPNTPGQVKISRKITDKAERKHLIEISEGLEIPEGMSIILRTAVLGRTARELKKDYDRLMRVWKKTEELAKKTKETPSLLCEENDLIYRAFRDLYSNDVEEIWVEDQESLKKVHDVMKLFMPAHRKRIKLYQDSEYALFEKYAIEEAILDLYQPNVPLPSGGYLILNQTEALVSIDVNSGKSTRERAMEETAFKTNLEAAQSIGKQLRLRDLSGLIVIDFIDMSSSRYGQVEKALEESLKSDRARIQVGKISHFGLLEMSRQRLRQSLFESITRPCHMCSGRGCILSDSIVAIRMLRQIARQAHRMGPFGQLVVEISLEVGGILGNQYRGYLVELEQKLNLTIVLQMQPMRQFDTIDFTVISPSHSVFPLSVSPSISADMGEKDFSAVSPKRRCRSLDKPLDEKHAFFVQEGGDVPVSVSALEVQEIEDKSTSKSTKRRRSTKSGVQKKHSEASHGVGAREEKKNVLPPKSPVNNIPSEVENTAIVREDGSASTLLTSSLVEMAKDLEVQVLKRRYRRRRRIFIKDKITSNTAETSVTEGKKILDYEETE